MVYDFGLKYKYLLDDPDLALAACWVHDTIEDCRQTYNDVKAVCGIEVADVAYALTNEKGKNRGERANDKYYDGIRNTPYATFVKVCDRLANTKNSFDSKSRMLDAYSNEYMDFKSKLYREDLKPMFDELEGYYKLNSCDRFKSAYYQYWDMVKDIIDEEGWVYTKEAPHMLDYYFEHNTGESIEFQKSFGKSGDNPHWLTKGSRWRPSELS